MKTEPIKASGAVSPDLGDRCSADMQRANFKLCNLAQRETRQEFTRRSQCRNSFFLRQESGVHRNCARCTTNTHAKLARNAYMSHVRQILKSHIWLRNEFACFKIEKTAYKRTKMQAFHRRCNHRRKSQLWKLYENHTMILLLFKSGMRASRPRSDAVPPRISRTPTQCLRASSEL